MRLYLNTSALNRPFDDQSLLRVRLETEAVLSVISLVESGQVELVSSQYLEFETRQTADPDRVYRIMTILRLAPRPGKVSPAVVMRAHALEQWGFRGLDALHIASAEAGKVDLLLTTDDRMIRRARRARATLSVEVVTPMEALAQLSPEKTR